MDELPEFEEGETVALKTSTQLLVVEKIRGEKDDCVAVVWIDKSGACHRDTFHKKALVKIDLK